MALASLRAAAGQSTQRIMLVVLLTLLPGTLAMAMLWGPGVLWNIGWLLTLCLATEAVMCALRGIAPGSHLLDLSTAVTAVLIGICLPPGVPILVLALAAVCAIGLAKHAYGGTGRNIFNPAMVGFAVALVSFPEAFATWSQLSQTDVLSGATQLSEFRYREGMTTAEFDLRYAATLGAQNTIAGLFAAGGAALLVLRVISWQVPVGALLGIMLASLFGYDQGSSQSHGSFVFHLFSGGFMVAMFFVATDPVTHPKDRNMQVLFGAIVGLLTYLIRAHGVYPDGIAFAILLANCVTPLLDRWQGRASNKVDQHA